MLIVLCNLRFNLKTRLLALRCYVFSILFYSVETCTLTETTEKRVDVSEMWCYHRILRIPWRKHTTNMGILKLYIQTNKNIEYCQRKTIKLLWTPNVKLQIQCTTTHNWRKNKRIKGPEEGIHGWKTCASMARYDFNWIVPKCSE